MRRWISGIGSALAVLTLSALAAPALAADAKSPALGRWDITLGDGPTPCWLEVTQKGDDYAGRFLFIAGSVFDLPKVTVDGDKVEFVAGNVTFTGTVNGDTITGATAGKDDHKGKWSAKRFVPKVSLAGRWAIEGQRDRVSFRERGGQLRGALIQEAGPARLTDVTLDGYTLQFTAGDKKCTAQVKGDVMEGTMGDEKFTAKRERQWGEPIELFNGKNLDGWKALSDPNNFKWKVVDGIMHCDGHGSSNIVSERTFDDFKLHVEFKVPKDGNSGVYLRGRYEIQVADSAGQTPDVHSCAALYSRVAPSEDAAKPADEWQTYDITLIDHYVTVVWNGKTVIDNQEIEGITGGAIDSHEGEAGPIYLQGDHTAIDYRKITLTPAIAPTPSRGRASR
jgi:hypothetical protein